MLNASQNSENLSKLRFFLSFTMLKSLMIITLLYLRRYLLRRLDRSPKKVSIFELHGGLHALKIAHLLFVLVISDNIISLFKLILSSKGLQIRPFLTYSINPPPFLFLSRRVRIAYWSITNCEFGKPWSNFVSASAMFLDQPLCNEDYIYLYTVYTYSNCMIINYYLADKCFSQYL